MTSAPPRFSAFHTASQAGLAALSVAALLGLSACGTVPVSGPPQSQTAPKILSVTKRDGLGVPNGRSDSAAPFTPLSGVSSNPAYGYTAAQAIKVGNGQPMGGPPGQGSRNEAMFLNALRSQEGKPVQYERLGSCCAFDTARGTLGGGLLDVFKVQTPDRAQPVLLYLNMYDPGEALAPQGFTPRSQP